MHSKAEGKVDVSGHFIKSRFPCFIHQRKKVITIRDGLTWQECALGSHRIGDRLGRYLTLKRRLCRRYYTQIGESCYAIALQFYWAGWKTTEKLGTEYLVVLYSIIPAEAMKYPSLHSSETQPVENKLQNDGFSRAIPAHQHFLW